MFGVDPWVFALCLSLGFCLIVRVFFRGWSTMIELVSLLGCISLWIGGSMRSLSVVIIFGSVLPGLDIV